MPSVNCSKVSHGIKVQELGKLIPYELTVNPGQDVAKEILEAWGASNRFGCILSASGSIARAVFGRPNSNEIRIYEGSFEILSMSGLYMLRDDGSEASSLSITLAASNGTAFAGTLINTLMANDTVQLLMAYSEKEEGKSTMEGEAAPTNATASSEKNIIKHSNSASANDDPCIECTMDYEFFDSDEQYES
ncbi:hypothetical protein HN51_043031 [Arachis hypogaea]|uniref:AT-hook motif nuclear-localized protein 6-like n=1 Tax=Arachis hypogaea TaxID=3818 RepID=UPI000DED7C10|nr:AT-hook motif nuclear-localized protein 6-like [Arachis hypogaea]